ncbi:hypothetical protein NDU88_002335 [Pleurodeles waltl]|uniref:Dickkopf N-terminal cysteine-rich domain-containing protein n=1 Tax=Pleurodeles waltl TaxID=8319 RepID=A0AAV7Q5N8_PLEWA|nr:hypothetical protein NDU88_002335 [Pleurodeles waltl]
MHQTAVAEETAESAAEMAAAEETPAAAPPETFAACTRCCYRVRELSCRQQRQALHAPDGCCRRDRRICSRDGCCRRDRSCCPTRDIRCLYRVLLPRKRAQLPAAETAPACTRRLLQKRPQNL